MLLPIDTIARSSDFEERASGMQLRPWQWEFLLGADGHVRLGDLARLCAIDFETAVDLVQETEALGLVEIVMLTLDGYHASAAYVATPAVAVQATPLSVMPAPEAASHAIALELPTEFAIPRKAVSVSFDSLSSMLANWETAEPHASDAHGAAVLNSADPHESFDESPLLENVPIDFEFPNHMEPLADSDMHFDVPSSDSYDDFCVTPLSSLSEHEHVDEPVAAEIVAHEPASYEPVEPVANVAPAKKSVSFSLSADSFGLPSGLIDTPSYDAHVDPLLPSELLVTPASLLLAEPLFPPETRILPELALAPEFVPERKSESVKKDDILLHYFHDEKATVNGIPTETPAPEAASDTRTNSDLTGVVLRVLGLKR